MATADEARRRAADAEAHRITYNEIMRVSTKFGVPFFMAMTIFFTQLVMGNGAGFAFLSFIVVFLAVWWIVKTFFTH